MNQMYQTKPSINPSSLIYKPTVATGIMDDDEAAKKLVKEFAGGLMNGFQVNPVQSPSTYGQSNPIGLMAPRDNPTMQSGPPVGGSVSGGVGGGNIGGGAGGLLSPVDGSGTYTADAAQGLPNEPEAVTRKGDYSLFDVMGLQNSLSNARSQASDWGGDTARFDVSKWMTDAPGGGFMLTDEAMERFGGLAGQGANAPTWDDFTPEQKLARMKSIMNPRPDYKGGASGDGGQ